MNKQLLDQLHKELETEGQELQRLIKEHTRTKSFGKINALEPRFNAWQQQKAHLEFEAKRVGSESFEHLANAGATPAKRDSFYIPDTKGYQLNPLDFDAKATAAMGKSLNERTPVTVKAFNSVESLLPAQLNPEIVSRIHENRFADNIPALMCTAPSYEFIVDSTSSNGVSGPTAEGAVKPDVSLDLTSQTVTMTKLAATFGLSYETVSDHAQILGYAQDEVMKQLIDVENAQFLNGSGTSGNMTGLLHTSGILTQAVPESLPDGANELDYFQKSIAALRVGPALAKADQVWIHPTTWSALAQLKDLYGRYLIEPDPVQDATMALFGVSVHQTTAMPAGTAILLDSSKFGYAVIREGITLHTGYNGTDFSQNIQRWALEERLNLAVVRPSAVLSLTGLPTAD